MSKTAVSTSRERSRDDIEWYCERRGSGPDVVLIPSGEGDCGSFGNIAAALADSFTVTTFDMPGMSRTIAPEEALEDINASKLAAQVTGLLDKLSINKATFWGCSSGGLISLALAAEYPNRVRNIIIHEVPLGTPGILAHFKTMDDAALIADCRHVYAKIMCEDEDKWNALGPAYHKRLEKNFVTWARNYVGKLERSFSKEELTRRPVCWTIGSLTPAGNFFQNVVDGYAAGITVGLLPSKHFPQVTVPDVLTEHIKSITEKHL